jgi:hypothetical protein
LLPCFFATKRRWIRAAGFAAPLGLVPFGKMAHEKNSLVNKMRCCAIGNRNLSCDIYSSSA